MNMNNNNNEYISSTHSRLVLTKKSCKDKSAASAFDYSPGSAGRQVCATLGIREYKQRSSVRTTQHLSFLQNSSECGSLTPRVTNPFKVLTLGYNRTRLQRSCPYRTLLSTPWTPLQAMVHPRLDQGGEPR